MQGPYYDNSNSMSSANRIPLVGGAMLSGSLQQTSSVLVESSVGHGEHEVRDSNQIGSVAALRKPSVGESHRCPTWPQPHEPWGLASGSMILFDLGSPCRKAQENVLKGETLEVNAECAVPYHSTSSQVAYPVAKADDQPRSSHNFHPTGPVMGQDTTCPSLAGPCYSFGYTLQLIPEVGLTAFAAENSGFAVQRFVN